MSLVTLEIRAAPTKGFHTPDQHNHATRRSMIDRGLVPAGRAIVHADKTEPLLWVADLLADARSDYLCPADRGIYPLIAHRVTRTTTVDGQSVPGNAEVPGH